MVKKPDELSLLKKNKTGIRFEDLAKILKRHGWEHSSTRGSHHVYIRVSYLPIMIVKPHGKNKYCHPMDVNKVIAMIESEK